MNPKLKILILEDVIEDVGLVERVLKRDGLTFTSRQVDSRETFIDAIEHFMPDVILSDHSLPQFNSIEALKICKERGNKIPFILVTGAVSEEFAVNCLKQGADDYVLKSNMSRLPSAIRNSIRHHTMEDEKKVADDHLRIQHSELTKINKELDTFVYNVSHSLRSPLASVLGLIHLVKRTDFEISTFPQYLTLMEGSVHKLDITLGEILDYSQNNRNEIIISEIVLKELIDESFDHLTYLDGYAGIKRIIEVDETPLFSDTYRLSVVLNNLISNSIKYSDKAKAEQIIRISSVVTEHTTTFCVEDNGIGIEEGVMPRVFDMFYRATQRSDGAGLGLYIVKEVVNVLGGKYVIASKINQGTSVTITIPNSGTPPRMGAISGPGAIGQSKASSRTGS